MKRLGGHDPRGLGMDGESPEVARSPCPSSQVASLSSQHCSQNC